MEIICSQSQVLTATQRAMHCEATGQTQRWQPSQQTPTRLMHGCMYLANHSRCSVRKWLQRAAADTCVAVFHFPQLLTATAWCASGLDEAAHSLRADIAISLPIIAAGNATIPSAGFGVVSSRCACSG